MKLVDLFWKSHVKHWWHSFQRYQEEQQKLLLDAAKMDAQITKESVEKYKDMKVAIFGKYICRVPVYKVERYRDGEWKYVRVENLHVIMLCLCIDLLFPFSFLIKS